jgi:hypothetical protein
MQLKVKRLRSRFLHKARREARAYPTAICKRRTTMSFCKKIKQARCFQLHSYGLAVGEEKEPLPASVDT